MEREQHKALIEAILFLKEEPVRAAQLAAVLEIPIGEVRSLLSELQQEFVSQQRGLRIFEIAGGYPDGVPRRSWRLISKRPSVKKNPAVSHQPPLRPWPLLPTSSR